MPWIGTFADLPEGATVIVDRYTFTVSYRGGDGNDVVLTVTNVAPDVLTYFLAEGATGGFFDEDVLIANPNDADAPVTLTFLLEGGGTIVEHRTVADAVAPDGARRSDPRPRERVAVGAGRLRRQAAARRRAHDVLGRDVLRRPHRERRREAGDGSGSSPKASRASSTPTC